jgi:hypothetical protein
MNDFLSRRSMLAGIGSTAVIGSLTSQLVRAGEAAAPTPAPAAAAPAQEMVYSTMFLTGAKTKFDTKKYETKHLPMLKQYFGASVSRIEMRTGLPTARGAPTDVGVTTSVYIADLPGFIAALRANGPSINADLDSIAKGGRNIQIDRLMVAVGAPRTEVLKNHQVMSTYYPDKPGATFDKKYFLDTYMPKLRSYYGDGAVRRIEVFEGVPQGEARPGFLATLHMYIRDRDTFNSANNEGQKETMQIDKNYTNVTEFRFADSKVTAIL